MATLILGTMVSSYRYEMIQVLSLKRYKELAGEL